MTPPAYLINLDGSEARLRSASAALRAAGIAFDRVPAFDGRQLTPDAFPDYDAAAAMRHLGRPMRGGEIGCYLSHLRVARRFLETAADNCLVFEDDLQLRPGAAEGIAQVLDWLARRDLAWDLIHLAPARLRIHTPILELRLPEGGHRLTRAHYFPMTTTALIWSRPGAEAFLRGHERIFAPVDIYFRHWLTRSNRGLAVWPPLVVTSGADSEIAPAAAARRSAGGRHPLYPLIRQYRMATDKLIALRHRWRGRGPGGDQAGSFAKRR
ncbi:glycosyltransferase family 25 protein [Paracoccus spongiarum]|uniref:Glycosyltransferase family 25 protein n=1 Tax=Paracoccus spongiarum TaxID=3064387 RepID=A0ABT9JBZ7_9RHOB|nr:glycosyltransferase family 25 protein [Paracoccus sp. 2205BS29-5]MDP5307341.1 glycosyltransferase family 25 protein [Paracoccus sp. 2205BS29-5]